ncbi:chromatin assembly factor 1 subunit B [Kwoniella mangroviensis CBS 8886]|uniref:uncharacterized protein n=1 Tax=Kwoniella mangroviensis CBS 8507 TaxID=1296122 RepID=UPI00080CD690|nr:chromatin assembly factor 1 subunit B [Kwoniella mangroviensis CBS 8507]OCF63786.1 chromatin assembly factor 1 subunit B [Kwoniella mangroviensis CBS 8507]OCF78703.1 chromatin assembly factor 1 subunit B [Kwoniella mangroviensis CBS 8886]
MRPKVLEISWHETQAVYSCDFQPLPSTQLKRLLAASTSQSENEEQSASTSTSTSAGAGVGTVRQYRLATAGGDSKVRLWMIHPNIPSISSLQHTALTGQEITPHPPRVEYLTTLSKHTAAVNVVRFSPNGQTLASAGDDGNVILWVPSDRPVVSFGENPDDVQDKEHWRLQKMLQVTTKHVYDLSWSPDGEFFIAGSTDNTATIWKAATGECVFALREHTHNVQGVSWDPLNEYIATQSSDRSVHVNTFAIRNNIPDVHPVSRATRMEIRHSRTPSIPSSTRPNLARRASTTSETGSVITTTSEYPEQTPLHHTSVSGAPATPNASVPSTPQAAAMNPPLTSNRPGSRRSSFSGSQAAASPSLSAAAFPGRGRSPSPIPPLPAIRAPPTSTSAIMQRLYGEEGVTRFFRRLTFSPDGSLLLTPAGQIEDQIFKGSPMLSTRSLSQDTLDREPTSTSAGPSSVPKPKNVDNGKPTVYIYSRSNLAKSPVAHLPGHKTAAVAIRFSPIFYDLRTSSSSSFNTGEPKHVTLDRSDPSPINVSLSMPPPPAPQGEKEKDRPLGSVFALPYRLLYAVACQDSVLLYDTQQAGPIAIFKGLHYAGFTDIAWSPDGQTLILSSSDGYCSIVVFDLNELGTVHPTQQHHRQLAAIAQSHSSSSTSSHTIPTPISHRETGSANATPTPVPHSPAVSVARHSPAPVFGSRSEREGSSASSIPAAPVFVPAVNPSANAGPGVASSVASASSFEGVSLPTPSDEADTFSFGRNRTLSMTGSESSNTGLGLGVGVGVGVEESGLKRPASTSGNEMSQQQEGQAEGQPKKKRRIALTHLGDDVGQ